MHYIWKWLCEACTMNRHNSSNYSTLSNIFYVYDYELEFHALRNSPSHINQVNIIPDTNALVTGCQWVWLLIDTSRIWIGRINTWSISIQMKRINQNEVWCASVGWKLHPSLLLQQKALDTQHPSMWLCNTHASMDWMVPDMTLTVVDFSSWSIIN